MSKINDVKILLLDIHSESSGKKYDVRDILIKLNIYEDIFSNFTTGSITVLDSKGILETMPIRGDEKLIVKFTGSEALNMVPFEKIFDIYKISSVESIEGKRLNIFTLSFASTISDQSNRNKLRIGFDDTESNIVKQIMKTNLSISNIEVEESKNKMKYIVPGWSPLAAINDLTESAQHIGDLESASYLFYEDKNNFIFKSLEHLLSQDTKYKFTQDIPLIQGRINFFQLVTLNIENYFDINDQSLSGGYGSRSYTVDVINKVCTTQEYLVDDMMNISKKIEDTAVILKTVNTDGSKRKVSNMYTDAFNPTSPYQMGTRDFMLGQLENFKVVGSTIGNSNLILGSIADLDIDTLDDIKDDSYNKVMSGNYIISAIRHELTASDYITTIEFRKPTMREEV